MRKPGPATFLFGNPATVLAAIGATAFFGYQWWSNGVSPLPAIIAFLAACQSMRSTDQLQKYNEWKREWEAMEGKATASNGAPFTLTPIVRFAIGLPLWCLGAYATSTVGDAPSAKVGAGLFWLGSLLMGAVLTYRALARKPQTVAVAKPSDPCVSVCLSPPQFSPSLAEARASIPSYCKALIQQDQR